MIGNLVKFLVAVSGISHIMFGLLLIFGFVNLGSSINGFGIFLSMLFIGLGFVLLIGISKLHERKR